MPLLFGFNTSREEICQNVSVLFFWKFKGSQFYSKITWPLKQTNDFEDIDPGIGRDQNSEENLYENQAYLEPDNLEISRIREKGKRLSPDHHQSNNNAIYANDSVVSSSTTFLRLLEIPCPFKINQLQGRHSYLDLADQLTLFQPGRGGIIYEFTLLLSRNYWKFRLEGSALD